MSYSLSQNALVEHLIKPSSTIINTIIIIIFILSIMYIAYITYQYISSKSFCKKKIHEYFGKKTVLIIKTHTWNDNLENFIRKLINESTTHGIDFFILMHSDNHKLINKIKDTNLKKYVLMFTEKDIRKVYNKGFYSMWLSNHWILMWFYKLYKNKYDYFWSIEYDVRISGDSSKLWKYNGVEDFIYPIEPFKDPKWRYKNHYVGGKLTDKNKYYGYLQLARYSNKFLAYLDTCYQSGENGQDELITFSLFKRGNFTGSKTILNDLIKKSWSVDSSDTQKYKKLLTESEKKYQSDKSHLTIFHPIK